MRKGGRERERGWHTHRHTHTHTHTHTVTVTVTLLKHARCAGKINAEVHLDRGIAAVRRENSTVYATDARGVEEQFDEIVFSCNAEAALHALERPRCARTSVNVLTFCCCCCCCGDSYWASSLCGLCALVLACCHWAP